MRVMGEEIMIEAPKVEAWKQLHNISCEMCGMHLNWWDKFVALLRGRNPCTAGIGYCAGGRAPVESDDNMLSQMIRGNSEVRPTCGGVMEPHLHVKCNACGHSFLMHVKTRRAL